MSDKNTSRPVRVMLVEDHASFRQALALVLGMEPDFHIVAQAGSLAEARAVQEEADLAIVDLALPDGDGSELIENLRRSNTDMTMLVLSATLDEDSIARAVEAGASGVVDKLASLSEIAAEARRLRAGAAMPHQPEVVEMLRAASLHGGQAREAGLTDREAQVLQALADGLDSKGIAGRLGITVEEERDTVAGILEKLGVRSGLQALTVAARRGLVDFR
jgi:DNA-binding NarL/FixJ family response regulator